MPDQSAPHIQTEHESFLECVDVPWEPSRELDQRHDTSKVIPERKDRSRISWRNCHI